MVELVGLKRWMVGQVGFLGLKFLTLKHVFVSIDDLVDATYLFKQIK